MRGPRPRNSLIFNDLRGFLLGPPRARVKRFLLATRARCVPLDLADLPPCSQVFFEFFHPRLSGERLGIEPCRLHESR